MSTRPLTSRDLAALANDHWIAAYRRLIADVGGDLREFGAVHAFVCRLPLHVANGCMVLDPAHPADLVAAIEWVHAAGIPCRVRTPSSGRAGGAWARR